MCRRAKVPQRTCDTAITSVLQGCGSIRASLFFAASWGKSKVKCAQGKGGQQEYFVAPHPTQARNAAVR